MTLAYGDLQVCDCCGEVFFCSEAKAMIELKVRLYQGKDGKQLMKSNANLLLCDKCALDFGKWLGSYGLNL